MAEQKQPEPQEDKSEEQENQSDFARLRAQIDPATYKRWDNEQKHIRKLIKEEDTFDWNLDKKSPKCLKYIGGVDISFCKAIENIAVSYLVVLSYPDLNIVYEDSEVVRLDMEYVPGFLAFREAGHLIKLFERLLNTRPDLAPQVILVDGNGILHQNACGLASHLGVLINTPTIGVGKTVFQVDGLRKDVVFKRFRETVQNGGDYAELKGDSGRIWGAALKSTNQVTDPIIVSIGHKISLKTACNLVYSCCKHRIPEPVRQADLKSREAVRALRQTDVDKAVRTNKLVFLTDDLVQDQEENFADDYVDAF